MKTKLMVLVALLAVLLYSLEARGALGKSTVVTFRLDLREALFNGEPPEAVKLLGKSSPLDMKIDNGASTLTNATNPLVYCATVAYPAGSAEDVDFTFQFKVEGLWLKECLPGGIDHVLLLDGGLDTQVVSMVCQGKDGRIVAAEDNRAVLDQYDVVLQKLGSALSGEAVALYSYYQVVALLDCGLVKEAQAAYDEFRKNSETLRAVTDPYDRFHIEWARRLARSGHLAEATDYLRAQEAAEPNISRKARLSLESGELLLGAGLWKEARSYFAQTINQYGKESSVISTASFDLGLACVLDSATVREGIARLSAIEASTTDEQVRRCALIVLGDAFRRQGNASALADALLRATGLGTAEQRLKCEIQFMEYELASQKYLPLQQRSALLLETAPSSFSQARLLYLDAVSLFRLGNLIQSQSQLTRLLKEYPDNPFTQLALAIIPPAAAGSTEDSSVPKGGVGQ